MGGIIKINLSKYDFTKVVIKRPLPNEIIYLILVLVLDIQKSQYDLLLW